jgi:hypothetical protein
LTPLDGRKKIGVRPMAYTQGELLVRAGVINAEAHKRALAMRASDGGSLGECLIRLGVIDEERLATFYHKRLVLPLLPETSLLHVAPQVLKMVPVEVAAEFRLLPLAVDRDGALLVAMADPSDNHAIEELGFFVDRFVLRAVATESAVRRNIERHYRTRLGSDLEVGPTAEVPVPPLRTAASEAPLAGPSMPRAAFVPTTISPLLPSKAAHEIARPLFPANRQGSYDPLGRSTAVGKKPADKSDEIVLLTRKKRSDETPLPPHAPPPDDLEAFPGGADPVPDPSYDPIPEPDVFFDEPGTEEPVLLTQRRSRERHSTLPGLHPDIGPPPLEALRAAPARNDVAALLLDYASKVLGRAVLFVVRGGQLCGYDARGGGLDRASVELLTISLSQDSLFREIVQQRLPFRGLLPATPHNRTLARALGADPAADVLLLPILVRDRVVALVFGDSLSMTLPEAALQALCYEAGLAYERVLRQGRGNSSENPR